MDIQARAAAGAQAVTPAMQTELVEPFIEAVTLTLAEMASTEAAPLGAYHRPDNALLGEVSAMLQMAGTSRMLALSFPQATAKGLADRIIAGADMTPDDELMRDSLGEVVNVVAGQAKALFAGTPYRFALSTPHVISGNEHGQTLGADCLAIVFQCDLGPFALQMFPAQ